MYITTPKLSRLMDLYKISSLTHGTKEDKLGDVFEDYCVEILNSTELLQKFKCNTLTNDNTDEYIFKLILSKDVVEDKANITSISATRDIEHRITGGNSKTDVIADITYKNGKVAHLPISVKQTTAQKVAMAEFDVKTITSEAKITDDVVIRLMTKHQTDASAKNFTQAEKILLKEHLKPFASNLVRWVLTGTVETNSKDLRFPKIILKIDFTKQDTIKDIHVYNINEYINSVMKNAKGDIKPGGFGTGLSWTYATGSKGRKIQFKG